MSARRWRGRWRRLGRWRGRRVASHLGGGGGSGGGTGSDVARAAVSLGRWCRLGGGVHGSDGGSGVGGSVASARGVCAVVIGSDSCGLGEQRGGQQAAGTEASEGQRRGVGEGGSERGCHGGRRLRCAVQPHARRIVKLCVRPSSASCARSMRGENARGSCTTGPAAVHQCTSCLWHARAPERGGRGMRRVGRRGSDGGQR